MNTTSYENTTITMPTGTIVADDALELFGGIAPKEEQQERFKLSTMTDVWENHEPLEYLVEGLIPKASVCQFVGDGGSKKTWALLDMAVCVAKGDAWLGLKTNKSPVIWLDEENGSTRMRRRLYLTLCGHLVERGENLPIYFSCLNGANFRDLDDVNALSLLVRQTGAGMVVVDPQVNVTGGAKENSAEEMQPFFNNLKRIADSTQAAVIIIHHNSKNGDYRGSTAIKGAVDVMVGVDSKPDSKFISFTNKKVRDDKVGDFTATANFVGIDNDSPDAGQFWLEAFDGNANASTSLGKPQRYVLRYLSTNGNSLLSDIESNADTCAPRSARDAVYNLADKGFLRRTDEGGTGKKAEYDLTDKGRKLAGESLK